MMLEQFIKDFESKRRAANTIKSTQKALNPAQDLIRKPLENATIEDLKKYFDSLKSYNHNSLSLIQSKVIQFYEYCYDETDDPKYTILARKLRRLKVDRRKKDINPQDILLSEDIKRLINVATLERDRCIVAVLFESGMRLGELLALKNSMVMMDEGKQEVVFNIPNMPGCKTGARSVVCLEVYGYVQDWLKCNPSDQFIPMHAGGLRHVMERLFGLAGITKPHNIHFFRHSSITNAAGLNMSETQLSYRFWGIPHSNMVSVYIHLNEMLQASGYRDAKGLGNGNGKTVINPLATRCINCGRLIQTGSLCKPCSDAKKLSEENSALKARLDEMEHERKDQNDFILQVLKNNKMIG